MITCHWERGRGRAHQKRRSTNASIELKTKTRGKKIGEGTSSVVWS